MRYFRERNFTFQLFLVTSFDMKGVVQNFNHVGVIVPDMTKAIEFWTNTLGVPCTEPTELAPKLLIAFAEMPNAKFELIQPLDPESPHGKWLAEHPKGGIHHVCFNTSKIPEAVEELKTKGVTTDMESPLVLTTGERVIFFNPDETLGMDVELYETNK